MVLLCCACVSIFACLMESLASNFTQSFNFYTVLDTLSPLLLTLGMEVIDTSLFSNINSLSAAAY